MASGPMRPLFRDRQLRDATAKLLVYSIPYILTKEQQVRFQRQQGKSSQSSSDHQQRNNKSTMKVRSFTTRLDSAISVHAHQSKVKQGGLSRKVDTQGANVTHRPFQPNPHELETLHLAQKLPQSDIAIGDRQYLHPFKNYGGLSLRHRGSYYEFPLLSHGKFFDGTQNRNPGSKRTVFTRNGEFANIVLHASEVKHGFRWLA